MSPSTIEKLVKELTSGSITSQAGLDNIYVEKGAENFDEMRSLIDTLSIFANWDRNRKEKLCQQIDSIEQFHKTYFEKHLDQSENKHSCMCLQCGFYDKAKAKIICNSDHKTFPCKGCQESFCIFTTMRDLLDEVERSFMSNNSYKNQPELEDGLLMWKENIKTFEENLVQFRAHLVQRVSEEKFDQNDHYLQEGECLCVMDYKMRVLPMSF